MLSILIPVYRYDVRPLVRSLLAQASGIAEPWEIICLDDGSPEDFREKNRELGSWDGVRYEELPRNAGRSKVRNQLAERARYPFLLFMDCDGMPEDSGFLSQYISLCNEDRVVVGTRAYLPVPPEDPDRYFHWRYGRVREQRPASERNLNPYDAFCTFHFLCPRDLYLSIRLDESLRQYGHEDTLFGSELKKRGITVLHIDNALIHIDVEPTEVFLEKTLQGIENLAMLARQNPGLGSRLLHAYWKIRPIAPLIAFVFRQTRQAMEWQFRSRTPNLRLFDLYKLGYLCALRP